MNARISSRRPLANGGLDVARASRPWTAIRPNTGETPMPRDARHSRDGCRQAAALQERRRFERADFPS